MGLWGPAFYRSGVNKDICALCRQIVDAVGQAYANRTRHSAGRPHDSTADPVRDSRPPRDG